MKKLLLVIVVSLHFGYLSAQWTTSGTNIYNSNTGNVGIGITTPTSPLHVNTNSYLVAQFKANTSSNSMITFTNNSGQMNIGIGGVTTHPYIWSGTGNLFIGGDGPNPTIYVKGMTSGSVGIGTTNVNDVNYSLFVQLGIRTRKIKVDQLTWPDYVFNKNYKLLTLDDVEQYIKSHEHLPGVSSAKEIEDEGLDLGENQAVLLKKIEELTLYLIDHNKKFEEQIKRLDQQGRRIDELNKKVADQARDLKDLKELTRRK